MIASGLVAALVGGVVWFRGQTTGDPLDRLRKAAGAVPLRAVEGWLSSFPYVRFEDGGGIDQATLRLQAEAADVLASHGDNRAATSQYAAGIAALMLGNGEKAAQHLEAAVAAVPSASYWNDLAAARYEIARTHEDPQTLIDALVATDNSLRRDARFPPAQYNRALILEALHQRELAIAAYAKCLLSDPSSPWVAEARLRKSRLQRVRTPDWKSSMSVLERATAIGDAAGVARIVHDYPQDSRSWSEAVYLQQWATGASASALEVARAVGIELQRRSGESLLNDAVAAIDAARADRRGALRDAHRVYLDAGKLYAQRQVVAALPGFERAAARFKAGGSPMALMAEYYVASCLYDLNRGDEALRKLDGIGARAPSHYIALRAFVQWERGTALSRDGRLHEALAAQRDSLAGFEKLGENHNAIFMSNAVAATLALLGRNTEAWKARSVVFRRLSVTDRRDYQQIALDTAARTEALGRRWDRAHSLLTLATDPLLTVNARVTTSSLLWRALAGLRTGASSAEADSVEAHRAASSVLDPQIRKAAEGDALFARAFVARARGRSAEAISHLTAYIANARERRDPFLMAEAFLERARARRARNEVESAATDLVAASRWVEERRSSGDRDEYREAFFSTADAARRELVDLWESRGETAKAFAALDTRGHERATPPDGTVAIEFVSLDDRLLLFIAESRQRDVLRVDVGREELGRVANKLSSLLATERDAETVELRQRLGSWLVEPARNSIGRNRTLVIIADPVLAGVPFAALPFGDARKFLVESVATVIAPETPLETARQEPLSFERLLSVGNPAFDRTVFPDVPDLKAAEEEANEVARAAGTVALIGAKATKEAVMEKLRTAHVAHLATHAFVESTDATRSFLLFAPSVGSSGVFGLREIEQQQLHSTQLVVLAGCRTGAPVSETANVNITSLALAFLRAGAGDVIATLWDVEDEVTRRFAIAFHREIRGGLAPAEALRSVQIRMLRSPNPVDRQLRSWSGFRAYSRVWPEGGSTNPLPFLVR